MRGGWLFLAGALALGGCVENPATGGKMFSLVGDRAEREVGEATAQDALKTYGAYKPASRINRYVTDLCTRLWALTPEAANPLQCLLLDDPSYNAWATPGYLNVNRGLLPFVNSEAELAAVMGHEAGHINAHHVGQKMTQGMVGGLFMTGLQIAVAAKTNNPSVIQGVTYAGSLSTQAALQTYSRAFETEADGLGLRTLQQAGYPPEAAVTMMQNMALNEAYERQLAQILNAGKPVGSDSLLGHLFASHPPTPERVAHASQLAAQLTAGHATPPTDEALARDRYMQAIDGMAFGPQTKYGVLTREALVLGRARLKLAIPDGFGFDYVPSDTPTEKWPLDQGVWKASHSPSYVKMMVAVYPYQNGLNPATFLQNRLPGIVDASNMTLADGTRAATARVTPRAFGSHMRAFAVADPDADAMVVQVYAYPTEAERDAEDATLVKVFAASRRLTPDEAAHVQPVKVRTFRASAGDTVANRAAYLPVGVLQEPLFRALNGITDGESDLVSGRLYKTLSAPHF